ncbi:molybdenum ABC transporter ATP-binding protein [Palleronia caenipelagi]|uniref:Molybdenum ABC transporter ATP-binding protein n=1 Tax=Palleronia caenipelagi TaxID=2489174 RepID=A0A547QA84_9RHOB|nr:molybdenum ABC transporter ATP-binding protein [Palleronia caenipelagi]TRD23305.1 molybdenum ABC transporter ATP-binding protein [Palleronia caenipelagi]
MTLAVQIQQKWPSFALDVEFDAPPGITVLFGRSGSGKTSAANAVAGLMRPDTGRLVLGGRILFDTAAGISLPPHRRRIGYVFQDARLFPHLTVRQNLTYGRWFAGRDDDIEMDRVVEMLGLAALLTRRPSALSGGEKSRVAIGRALLSGPDLLIADEPLAALDEPRKAEILPYFEWLRDETGLPILYVSHSVTEVARLATTVVVLEAGRVIRQGDAAEVLGDPTVTPTGIRDVGALITARLVAHHSDGLSELDAGGIPLILPQISGSLGREVRLRLPAQDMILSRARPEGLSALNVIPGTIISIRDGEGPGALVVLETAAGRVLSRITRRSVAAMGLASGMTCYAIVKTVAIAAPDAGG